MEEKNVAFDAFVRHNVHVSADIAQSWLQAVQADERSEMAKPANPGNQRRNRVVILLTDEEFREVEKLKQKYGPTTPMSYVIREGLKKGLPDIFA